MAREHLQLGRREGLAALLLVFSFLSSPAQSETVITVNQGLRGGRVTELKQTVDQAVKWCPKVKRVLVSMRTEQKVPMSDLDVPLDEVRCSMELLVYSSLSSQEGRVRYG